MAQITDEFREKVKKAATSVVKKFKQLDPADVEQDLWVRLFENPEYLHKMLESEDPHNALVRIAKQVASKEMSTSEYFSGQYNYTPSEVRLILGRCLIQDPSLANITQYVDLHEGMRLLEGINKNQHKVIIDKWIHGIEPKYSARTTEALDRLTQLMNQVNRANRYNHDGPGSRKVLSNAQSQAKTGNNL